MLVDSRWKLAAAFVELIDNHRKPLLALEISVFKHARHALVIFLSDALEQPEVSPALEAMFRTGVDPRIRIPRTTPAARLR
jgi:hypothetical protein